MKISERKKFIVGLGVVFVVSWVLIVSLFYEKTREYAVSQGYEKIQNLLFNHRAIHSYIEEMQKPVIYSLKKRGLLYEEFFSPDILSFTFIARNIKDYYNKEMVKNNEEPIYFKLASKNPRNPINQADGFEKNLIEKFNETNETEYKKVLEEGGKSFLYVALPIAASKESCMRCHSDPAIAPKELVEMYGDQNGFFEKVGEIRAIISIKTSLAGALKEANEILYFMSAASFIVFAAIFLLICYFFNKIGKQEESLAQKTKELEELNKTLEERVADETEKRLKHQEILVQQSKMASMGEMIGAIAHQWKQPLNALSVVTQDVKYAYEDNEIDDKYISNFIEKTGSQIRYMSKTIDDFRNFFKPDKQKATFDVLEAIDESIALMGAGLKNNNITLVKNFPSSCISLYGNKTELAQVFLNIFANAKDALSSSATRERVISVEAAEDRGWIYIRIQDNGGGIDSAMLDRLFEPYTTTKKFGTGIGLYMSKIIVEEGFGGSLTAVNAKDGAKFEIKLERFKDN